VTVTAAHDGYRRLRGRVLHRRTWAVSTVGVTITDELEGTGDHTVDSRVRFATAEGAKVEWTQPAGIQVTEEPASYATGFGRLHAGHLVTATWTGQTPVTLRMELLVKVEALQRSEAGAQNAQTLNDAI
ncbi:MAG: heparinase II/III-family protein, partial [Actinomycetota bacterium]|nr:heparinase II/III-family protein [Actinomycetota bacterium]